jgi:hypothetical protein
MLSTQVGKAFDGSGGAGFFHGWYFRCCGDLLVFFLTSLKGELILFPWHSKKLQLASIINR